MQFDPEFRDYILYYFLQELRQLYFDEGDSYGLTIDTIEKNIKNVLRNRGWTDTTFEQYEIKEAMLNSIASELQQEEYITDFELKKKKGLLFKKVKMVTYYQITQKGIHYIRDRQPPGNPLKNIIN